MLAVLGLLLYGAGANVSAGWVVVLASVAVGALPWGWWSARRASRTVEVTRTLPPTATAGAPVPVTLEVRARSAAMAVVHDELGNVAGVAGDLREGATLTGRATLPRGAVRAGTVRLWLGDPFGLLRVELEGEVPTEAVVLPSTPPLTGARHEVAWALEVGDEALRAGHGTDVVGVREYRPGDPVRSVHWRSSARRGELVVRELAEPAQPRLRVEVGAGTWDRVALDRAAEVCAAVATDGWDHGMPVTLGADGTSTGWGPAARRHLALLPPHAGAEPRPLAAPPQADAEVRVTCLPTTEGPLVRLASGDTVRDLGVVPLDATPDEVAAWLAVRVDAVVAS
ncbi:MAG: DUF58 domain-containing protein [Actinomycetes bacterium]